METKKSSGRPTVNHEQVARFAAHIKTLKIGAPLNFWSFKGKDEQEVTQPDMYPEPGDPHALNFFFAAMLQNHGFWYGDTKGYKEPLVGVLDGKVSKGSDLLWRMLFAAQERNPEIFWVERLCRLDEEELRVIMSDDNGPVPFEDSAERLLLWRNLGSWCLKHDQTLKSLVATANTNSDPARALLDLLMKIPGYSDDRLQKKSRLLLLALMNRPEHWIVPEAGFQLMPMVDYHLMRLALRLGLVDLPPEWVERNIARSWVNEKEHDLIRIVCYAALVAVLRHAGIAGDAFDLLLWSGRRYCPEMEEPKCGSCIFNSVCAKRIEFFQPIYRRHWF